MAAFDYKKEYKEFYLPPKKPQIIEIPSMNFSGGTRQRRPERGRRGLQGNRSVCCTEWPTRLK